VEGAKLPVTRSLATLPEPRRQPVVGHLGRWGREPLGLLQEGAALGGMFRMRLWRPVVVGYGPDWNRVVLRDLETFRSGGSLATMTPYLNGGVVVVDAPAHRGRRQVLNPHLRTASLHPMEAGLTEVVERSLPTGRFETLHWSAATVRSMLNQAFFGGRIANRLLASFLDPLHRGFPHPFARRRRLFARMSRAIEAQLADPAPGSLAVAYAEHDNAAEELRVSLAAGFDTTAHTLAWALWHLSIQPEWRDVAALPLVIDEVLRLYPAGWLGSRITSRDTVVSDLAIPAHTMVLYSPFLTHRDPELWPDPLRFHPARFREHRPPWGFIPFGAGERTCLGAHLARLILRTALAPFSRGNLEAVDGDPTPRAGLTLRPGTPLVVRRTAAQRPVNPQAVGQPVRI
jgi:cytochrome P450